MRRKDLTSLLRKRPWIRTVAAAASLVGLILCILRASDLQFLASVLVSDIVVYRTQKTFTGARGCLRLCFNVQLRAGRAFCDLNSACGHRMH